MSGRGHHGTGVGGRGLHCDHHAGRHGFGTLQQFVTLVLMETGEANQRPLGAIRELIPQLEEDPAALVYDPK